MNDKIQILDVTGRPSGRQGGQRLAEAVCSRFCTTMPCSPELSSRVPDLIRLHWIKEQKRFELFREKETVRGHGRANRRKSKQNIQPEFRFF